MMKRIGTFKNITPNHAATFKPMPASAPMRAAPFAGLRSEGIEGTEAFGDAQVNRHDDDGHHAESRGQGQVSGSPLILIDQLADEGPRRSHQIGNDVVAKGQREGEDRTRSDARNGQREDHLAESLPGLAPRSLDASMSER